MMPETTTTARAAGYVPLGAAERQRRALFLQSYRFSVDGGREGQEGEGLRGRLLRRLREAGVAVARAAGRARGAARWWVGAGLARACRGWRPRVADHPLLGCFGAAQHHHHHKYYLHGYA